MFRLLTISTYLILFTSCGNAGNSSEETSNKSNQNEDFNEKQLASVDDFAIVEPVKKFIYYINEVDISTYDSISTQYFHEVLDYTDTAAIAIENEICTLQNMVKSDSIPLFKKEDFNHKIDSLAVALAVFQKEVTGYVFVHTFLNNGDTLSAIIVTNADMTKGEAIPVSHAGEIEPTAFTNNVRKIE